MRFLFPGKAKLFDIGTGNRRYLAVMRKLGREDEDTEPVIGGRSIWEIRLFRTVRNNRECRIDAHAFIR